MLVFKAQGRRGEAKNESLSESFSLFALSPLRFFFSFSPEKPGAQAKQIRRALADISTIDPIILIIDLKRGH